ncbi:hypothetical protein [Streptomyces sp. NPDC004266]|uniref:hypothetical protein n=1 Tax=Streptomyces sp. NPDC004266 TaxID=3364693 RepID=UPI003696338B
MKVGARDVVHGAVDEKSYEIRLAVKSLVRGSESDLDGVRVDGGLKGRIPHCLPYEITDTGKKKTPYAYEVFRDIALSGTDWMPGK